MWKQENLKIKINKFLDSKINLFNHKLINKIIIYNQIFNPFKIKFRIIQILINNLIFKDKYPLFNSKILFKEIILL